jgi:hypothetical protein
LATILVLGILAIAMALSYSVMRSQTTAVQIQTNTRHAANARLAAMTGMSAALRKMHELTWAGVETEFNGGISPGDRYTVTYTTGDASLLPADAKYGEFPFRVTVVATGYSQDAASGVTASHAIRAVVRLNPARTATPPTGWNATQAYTVFQTGNNDFEVNVPMRIEGLVRVQGTLRLGEDYGWSTAQRREYFEDLNAKRIEQGLDYRPFNSRIDIPAARLPGEASYLLSLIAIPTQNVAESLLPNWAVSSASYSYRLYPGGKQYNAQTVASTLSNVTLAPDPITNPAGVFQVNGGLTLNNNVSIQGTLLTAGSGGIEVRGQNVNLTPFNLPAVVGGTVPVRLPTIVSADNLRIRENSNATITGLVYVGGEFRVDDGTQMSPFSLTGRLITRRFDIGGRTEYAALNWGGLLSELLRNLIGLLFPDWLYESEGLDPTPRIRFLSEGSTPVASYHWSPTAATIFVPDPADTGLRWDLVSWSDGSN